ncbi:hypothetical protein ABZX85_41745 [Streptomyces sp. NPDC004539]|uniref:hypothetical protein n=1 Tax=Streptomyces sp. NPDC004539 TaxID=3154280 RepID=UPI0033B0014F
MTHSRVVLLQPGDHLLIGNLKALGDEGLEALHEVLPRLREALRLGGVVAFEDDVTIASALPLVPASDAVVLRVFERETVEENFRVLAAWVEANGIDPETVAADWLTIELHGEQRLIRYRAYRTTADGRRLRDPGDRSRAWTIERVAPLLVDLELPDPSERHPG